MKIKSEQTGSARKSVGAERVECCGLAQLCRFVSQPKVEKLRQAAALHTLRAFVAAFVHSLTPARVALCLMLTGATVIGCGWYGPINSVRFNGFLTERDFYRLPPLPKQLDAVSGRPVPRYFDQDEETYIRREETAEQRAREIDEIWQMADAAEQRGEIRQAAKLLQQYLTLTAFGGDTSGQEQERRNSAIDRLDAIQALDHGARLSVVQAYLSARRTYEIAFHKSLRNLGGHQPAADEITTAETVRQLLKVVPAEPQLKDNFAYLRAALFYREDDFEQAARAFNALAAAYPHSEKREAALLMTAIVTMKSSCSFAPVSADAAHNYAEPHNRFEQKKTALPEPCVDEAWKAARAAFNRVIAEYPQGRYTMDARGWLGYLNLRAGDRASALAEYYRMLANDRDVAARAAAVASLTYTRHHATAAEMDRVEAELMNEPAAALAYAYHNLYNYAPDPGCPDVDYYATDEWEEKWLAEKRKSTGRSELIRTAAFATRLLQRYPKAAVSGAFALRVAQANLENGNNKAALEMARRAFALGLKGAEYKQALWVKGVAEHHLRDDKASRGSLLHLIAEDHNGELTTGARRLLAMVSEDAGDLSAALEQYLALGYETDVAYFIDVLMTPEQLASFIEAHPQTDRRNELLYALGVRYLRDRRWNEARATLARVQTRQGEDPYDGEHWYGERQHALNPKEKASREITGIHSDWVRRDLQTITDLERLEREVELAAGDEAKAEAMYQLASYQYEASRLLFYNPRAWNGERYFLLSELDRLHTYRMPNEAALLWAYMQSHETLARALPIYLEIARRYPQTRAARDALYTAAICHERLSDYNPYWRSIYAQGMHAGERMVTYRDVRTTYPRYQLPRATMGWQPSTRTVNGGPAWDAPPKPKPRPTLMARVKIKLGHLWDAGSRWTDNIWQGRVWPALISIFYAVCIVGSGYLIFIAIVLLQQRRAAPLTNELICLNLRSGLAEAKAQTPVERIISRE